MKRIVNIQYTLGTEFLDKLVMGDDHRVEDFQQNESYFRRKSITSINYKCILILLEFNLPVLGPMKDLCHPDSI